MAQNLQFEIVVIDSEGKPKCEVFCPFEKCGNVSKLSTTKQTNGSLKFNPYNFERHFVSQHVTRKCKPLDDITNITDPEINRTIDNTVREVASDSHNQQTPSTSYITRLENDLRQYKTRIDELEMALQQKQQQQQQQQFDPFNMKELKDELLKYQYKFCEPDRESLVEIMGKCCRITDGQESDGNESLQTDSENFAEDLKNEISQCQAKIVELETNQTQRVAHVKKMAIETRYRREENILLRHKIMDIREKIK